MTPAMSVEILMDPICSPPPAAAAVDDAAEAPPAAAKPVHVLISPIVPASADGALATAQPPAYTGVLYLHHKSPLGQQHEDDPKKKRKKWLKDMRGWLMVLAVLAASVTYQAGLNPPGGFWQDHDEDHRAGDPVLQSSFPRRYSVFLYFNATAFVTSVVIIILLMNESFYHSEVTVEALEIIVVLDMVGLMCAYISGCTRTVTSSFYLTVLTAVVVVFIYVVYTAKFLPKLWGLVVKVPCVHNAARDGALSVPHHILE